MISGTIPPVQNDWLPRARLLTSLDEAARHPLMWIQSPAGFGKTTALIQWLQNRQQPATWVTLSPDMQSAETLLSAIGRALPKDESMPDMPRPDADQILNRLSDPATHLTLVLDNLENLTSDSLYNVIEHLIRHAGDGYRLILVSRSQPDLPLNTCRLNGQLGEVSLEQLHFTPYEESALRSHWGLEALSPAWQSLAATLSGWIAGWVLLRQRLMQGGTAVQAQADIEGYLVESSLSALPDEILKLLTTLSCCEKLSDGLINALSASSGALTLLGRAEASGAFIWRNPHAPGQWVMHPALRQALSQRLKARGDWSVQALHARAAGWLLTQGSVAEALPHGLQSGRSDWLRGVLCQQGQALLDAGETALVQAALSRLPEETLRRHNTLRQLALQVALIKQDMSVFEPLCKLSSPGQRSPSHLHSEPPLCLYLAQAALMHEDVQTAEIWMQSTPSGDTPPLPKVQIHSACIRGELAICRGQYADARDHFEDAEGLARAGHHHQQALWAMAQQAEIAYYRGQPDIASNMARRFEHYEHRHHLRATAATEHLLRVQVCVNLEWLKLDAAERDGQRGLTIARKLGISDLPALSRLAAQALLGGQENRARKWLEDAFESLYAPHCHSDWITYHDQVWLRLRQLSGEHEAIERWLYRNPPLRQARNHFEYRHGLNRQLALLALDRPALALEEGRQLSLSRAERELDYLRMQRLILSALSAHLCHHTEQATRLLREALAVSERMLACATWCLADKADPALSLMLDSLVTGQQPPAKGAVRVHELLKRMRQRDRQPSRVPEDARRLALTKREWDVLEKVGDGLSNEQIASALFVAPSTVRSHLKSIYQKLGVHHREGARHYVRSLSRDQAASRNPSSP